MTRKTTSRGSGCREFVCYRGWSNYALDDLEPISGFSIVGIEAKRLAEKDRSGLVLVAACSELADQAIRKATLRIEPDDRAQIDLRFEITAESNMRTGAQ